MSASQRRAANNDSPDAYARDGWPSQGENRCWASGSSYLELATWSPSCRAASATELVGSEIGEGQQWVATMGEC
jgi:hypothetical protein